MLDLRAKLEKTRRSLGAPLRRLLTRPAGLCPDEEEQIEEILLRSDVGVGAAEEIIRAVKERGRETDPKKALEETLLHLLSVPGSEAGTEVSPRAVLLVGVNGVGKTTTAAKLAHYHLARGKGVVLGACDTFRAAAREQISVWAEMLGVKAIAHAPGGDPAAVAFDACSAARARGLDYAILDTAGRLHTRTGLMEELAKIKRVCRKAVGEAGVETLLVIDANLGQNSLVQARSFTETLGVDGMILAKMDSSAKGGIVVAIARELGVPVRFMGLGEGLEDLIPFRADQFVQAMLD